MRPAPTNSGKSVECGNGRRDEHRQQYQHKNENGLEHSSLTFSARRMVFVGN
jgi:hypothetical protein